MDSTEPLGIMAKTFMRTECPTSCSVGKSPLDWWFAIAATRRCALILPICSLGRTGTTSTTAWLKADGLEDLGTGWRALTKVPLRQFVNEKNPVRRPMLLPLNLASTPQPSEKQLPKNHGRTFNEGNLHPSPLPAANPQRPGPNALPPEARA